MFNLVTFIEELSELRAGTPVGSWLRTGALVLSTAVSFGLGLFTAVIDPRHFSEVLGVGLLMVAALGGVALLLRLRRHARR